jgi:Nidogen-like/PEP-CTERM motif
VRYVAGCLLFSFVMFAATPAVSEAGAIVPGVFDTSTLASNDDGSTGLVPIGFTVNYFGTNYSQLFVNNNGNVTFNAALGTFTPFGLLTSTIPIIAPFFADVDTRDGGADGTTPDVTYGTGTFGGRPAFGVNWLNVEHFNVFSAPAQSNLNSFQLIMVERFDTGPGNFDFLFNYDQIQWEAGEASGSSAQGCGGSSARVGWTNGGTADFELAGSGVDGAFLDSGNCPTPLPGPNALILGSLNSDIAGRYLFEVREGEVGTGAVIPEPASLLLLGTGLAAIARRRSRRKN